MGLINFESQLSWYVAALATQRLHQCFRLLTLSQCAIPGDPFFFRFPEHRNGVIEEAIVLNGAKVRIYATFDELGAQRDSESDQFSAHFCGRCLKYFLK